MVGPVAAGAMIFGGGIATVLTLIFVPVLCSLAYRDRRFQTTEGNGCKNGRARV